MEKDTIFHFLQSLNIVNIKLRLIVEKKIKTKKQTIKDFLTNLKRSSKKKHRRPKNQY